MKRIVLKATLVAAWGLLCFYCGRNVSYAEQTPIYDALREMSAIVFGIMGAWIAVLHPDLLMELVKPNKTEEESIPDTGHLIAPMIYSAITLAMVLTIGVLVPLVRQID